MVAPRIVWVTGVVPSVVGLVVAVVAIDAALDVGTKARSGFVEAFYVLLDVSHQGVLGASHLPTDSNGYMMRLGGTRHVELSV